MYSYYNMKLTHGIDKYVGLTYNINRKSIYVKTDYSLLYYNW